MKYPLVFILLLFNCTSFAQKAIFSGGEITYEHIADSTYRFYANLYLDCAGGQEPPTIPACFNNPCNSTLSFTTLLTKTNNRGNVAQMGCSQYPTNCSEPGAIRGYRIWRYSAIVTLPAQCNSWNISVVADTMTKSLSLEPAKFYLETTFNNTGTNRNNSSPFFASDAVAYCGEGQPFMFRSEQIDPDGDLLITEVDRPLTADSLCSATIPIPFKMGMFFPYSIITNPFHTNNTFRFNRHTGDVSFNAGESGTAVIAFKTYEYRNGKLLGMVTRNQIIHIMPAPIRGEIERWLSYGDFYNCKYNGYFVTAHANDSLSFHFTYGAEGNWLFHDNCDSVLPGASIVYENQYSSQPNGRFSFKPTINDTGIHDIRVRLVDSTCLPPGFTYNYYNTLRIYVDPTPSSTTTQTKNQLISLYPNPNNGRFTLNTAGLNDKKLSLVNNMGQIVKNDIQATNGEVILPGNLPDGIYTLKIYSEGSVQTIPFVLSR